MKIHPLAWLEIADYLQRHGHGLLSLHGVSDCVKSVVDVPLISNGENVQVDITYLKTKMTQLANQGSLQGFVVLKNEEKEDKIHSKETQSILVQLLEHSKELYVLEIDPNDFRRFNENNLNNVAKSKFYSSLYKFDNMHKQLVVEKWQLESQDAEKLAINSVITHAADRDDLTLLNATIQQKKHFLEIMSAKINTVLDCLRQGSLDQDMANRIGELVSLIEPQSNTESEVARAFEEENSVAMLNEAIALITANLLKSSSLIDTNLELSEQI